MNTLYARWIDQLLQKPIPNETKATCLDCAMCPAEHNAVTAQDIVFNPKTKCCTYHPHLPNFLVGDILNGSPSETSHSLLQAQLRGLAVVRPQGVSPSLAESAGDTFWNPAFGKNESLRCPYFMEASGGLCGIWEHRNARCSTWFCKHVRGAVGREFWRTLRELLADVEQHLSVWCIHSLEAGSQAFRELFPPPRVPNLDLFQRQQAFNYRSGLPPEWIPAAESAELKRWMWGRWLGREELFFRECSFAVAALSWDRVLAIGGEPLAPRAGRAQKAFADLQGERVPAVLRPSRFHTAVLAPGSVRVWAYSFYDPVDLPAGALKAIRYFDGRTTEIVVEWVGANTNLPLTMEMVRTMVDYGILTAVS